MCTQSIVLAQGSVVDVSSGGYVQPNGQIKFGANGLPAGNGGNLSLISLCRRGDGQIQRTPIFERYPRQYGAEQQ